MPIPVGRMAGLACPRVSTGLYLDPTYMGKLVAAKPKFRKEFVSCLGAFANTKSKKSLNVIGFRLTLRLRDPRPHDCECVQLCEQLNCVPFMLHCLGREKDG